jgi:hypothetical protein
MSIKRVKRMIDSDSAMHKSVIALLKVGLSYVSSTVKTIYPLGILAVPLEKHLLRNQFRKREKIS